MTRSKSDAAKIDEKEFDRQYRIARESGEYRLKTTPRAASAYYDDKRKRVVVELTNGCVFLFPSELAQGLAGASPKELAQVRVMPSGFALGWDSLDVHFNLTGLLAGEFGNQKWMADLKRRNPPISTSKKTRATTINGNADKRPRKIL